VHLAQAFWSDSKSACGANRSASCLDPADLQSRVATPTGPSRLPRSIQLAPQGAFTQLDVEALILELRDFPPRRGYQPSGAVARLLEYDRGKGMDLIST